ncbi:MAG: DUF4340 domain-containing protein [Acetobacteraceae bacterium]|nr:DUF4340 domain-containing protein [Acetobacteraceae bacterium]
MNRTLRRTLLLAIAGIVALFVGWQFGMPSHGGGQKTIAPGTLVFPGLAAKLQDAQRVTITTKGHTLTLVRHDGIWGIAERGGYRAQQDRLRELLTGLTELRVTEPRTADPAQYDRLGVGDPNKPVTTANLLRVYGPGDSIIAELIVGHRRVRTAGNVPESIYIRRVGEAQSWLAEGRLPVDADPQLWFEREITNIRKEQVASVVTTRAEGTLEFGRDGDTLVLTSPAEHPKLDEYRVEDVFRALDGLTLTEVKPAAEQPGEKIGTAVYTLTDGMTVTVTVFRQDTDIWAQFHAAGAGEAKAKADALNARVAGWAYQVGAWKEKAFLPLLDELKANEPAKGAPAKE